MQEHECAVRTVNSILCWGLKVFRATESLVPFFCCVIMLSSKSESLRITIVYRRLSPAGIQLVFIRDLKIRVQGRGYEDTQEIDTAKSFIVSFFTIKVGTHIFIEGGY